MAEKDRRACLCMYMEFKKYITQFVLIVAQLQFCFTGSRIS